MCFFVCVSFAITVLVGYTVRQEEDPGLRAAAARLGWRVMRGACLESGAAGPGRWFPQQEEGRDLLAVLVDGLQDSSSTVVRAGLAGAGLALPLLLQCGGQLAGQTAALLTLLPALASQAYWLVRLDLCDLLARLNPLPATFLLPAWPRLAITALLQLLGDVDTRVRAGATRALLTQAQAGMPCSSSSIIIQAATSLAAGLPSSAPALPPPFFPLVSRVTTLLATAASPQLVWGCLDVLASLAKARPPRLSPQDWGVHPGSCPARPLLARAVGLLTASPPCHALPAHSSLLSLSASLQAGMIAVCPDWAAEQGELILAHHLKLLSILHHVFEESVPALPSSKPSLPSLPNASLSPIKKKSTEPSTPVSPPAAEKSFTFKETVRPRGSFVTSPHYMRLYELVRASYNVYKSSAEPRSEEKLCQFSDCVLDSFSLLLEQHGGPDLGKIVEELLSYIRSCMSVSPTTSLKAVRSLLHCLFRASRVTGAPPVSAPALASHSVLELLVSRPYTALTTQHSLAGEPGSPAVEPAPPPRPTSRPADRSALASYIRLFEPVVIRALKQYTVTSDLQLQAEVLQLLAQLVRLRVNYCLLDSDQIFIGFVIKQLEGVAEGQLVAATPLIPHIMEFLILLSYERYHSKVIVEVPVLLQLCEALGTGGPASQACLAPALAALASDLYGGRGGPELETQREVVVRMVMREVGRGAGLDTLANLLDTVAGEETVARQLSSQALDTVLPLLCSHQLPLVTADQLLQLRHLFRALAPAAVRPCDRLISSLLATPCDLASLPETLSWLAFTTTSLLTVFRLSPEEAVLARLAELGIMLGSGGSSGLLDSMDSSLASLGPASPDLTLATFLLHAVGSAASKLHQLHFSSASQSCESADSKLLASLTSDLLLLLAWLLQSGRTPRLARAVTQLARDCSDPQALHNVAVVTELVVQLRHSLPCITSQWQYCLVLLGRCSTANTWAALGLGGRQGDNTAPALPLEVCRQAALATLAQHLADSPGEGELLAWFLSTQVREIVVGQADCPTLREFVLVTHRQPAASGLLLEAVAARLEGMRGAECVAGMMAVLGPVHPAHAGRLVSLLVRRILHSPLLALARQAAALATDRLQFLLTQTEAVVQEQLGGTEVAGLLELLARRHLARRHPHLVSLLNRLAMAFYDLSPLELGEGRKFNPSSVSNVALDRAWHLQQVKRACCAASPPPQECATLLANLGLSDIMLVITAKDFNLSLLEECLVAGLGQPDCRAPSLDSLDRVAGLLSDPDRSPGLGNTVAVTEGPPLYRAASQVLLQHIKNIGELLPRPVQVCGMFHEGK